MRKILFTLLAAAMLVACHQPNKKAEAISRLMEQYPQMTMQDVYKSFYQDRFGAGHMINDTAAVREYTMYELTVAAEDTVTNPYYELLGTQGRYVRVYLRCVNEGLLSAEQLLDAFIRSAQQAKQPEQSWADEWAQVELTAREAGLTASDEDLQLLRQAAENQRAVHHSDSYRNAYHPHYRIVERTIFENELKEKIINHIS